jgi:purine-nucleoside phosphorylase
MFDIKTWLAQIEEAAASVRARHAKAPDVGIICGTGMGALADKVAQPTVVPYDDIPHFPLSTVESHHGNLILGELGRRSVMVMQGRFHCYEGYSMREVTFPVRVMKALGCRAMIVMNAVGSVNAIMPRGSLMLIRDQINLMGDNPLIGPNDETLGPRFPDMSEPYSRGLIDIAEAVALEAGIKVHQGVLVAVTGPNLETAAEYRMFQIVGADAVTMSTIPEVIVANHAGMKVLGISTVTDNCFPDALEPAQIEEIIAVAQAAEPRLEKIVTGVLARIGEVIDQEGR